ncbi:lipoprotein [Plantactinospora sp. CA-290183]|uniref:lipoprotein n=1 Tax=Plantactinospora sp. CA-290183 TaxID=3240006 RepID=UPI003D8ABEE7
MYGRFRVVMLAALAIGLVAGCGDTDGAPEAEGPPSPSASPVPAGPPWYDDVPPAAPGDTIGADGTPCATLRVTFDMPTKWTAKPVEVTEESAELAQLGGANMWCEIDAKPAGAIGFLRVWMVDKGAVVGARKGLEQFLAAYGTLSEVRYRDTKAGPISAIEATFLQESELTGDRKRGRAMVVATRLGTYLFTLGGTDTDEFEAMFPAYQLMKQSFAVKR